jgi:threonine/homoserine/homoserine lactone efflux protein
MTLQQIWITAFLVAFSGAMVPGPVLSVTITEVSKKGVWAGPLIVLGHGILELVLIIAFFLGFSRFVTSPAFLKIVAIAGGGVLLWMGVAMTVNTARKPISLQLTTDSGKTTHAMPVLLGVVTTASTPFWYIWWLTVGLTYLLQSLKYGKMGVGLFFSGHILADLAWYSLISFTITLGKRFFSNYVYKVLLLTSSVFLIGMGIYFIWFGMMKR